MTTATRYKYDRLSLLRLEKAGEKFLTLLTPQQTHNTLLQEAVKLSHAQASSLFLKVDNSIRRISTTSPKLASIKPRPDGVTQRAFQRSTPFVTGIDDIQPIVQQMGVQTIISLPLVFQKKTFGVLTMLSKAKKKGLNSEERKALKIFGILASLAIIKSEQRERVEQALALRDFFISTASHEMRTPMTTIELYAKLISQKIKARSLPDKKWSNSIIQENNRLHGLLDELLQINQIEQGTFKYNFHHHSLLEVVQQAVEDFKLRFPTHRIVTHINIERKSPIIYIDKNKILQVLANILNNAGKYSKPHTTITIDLGYKGPYCCISVTDQGKGIPKKDLPHIFNAFYQGKKNAGQGSGLGLYIAKQIIDTHKGSLQVKSNIKKGTTFELCLLK